METIKLYKLGESWMAQSNCPKVKELFGTDTIPTAFTARADGQYVLGEIKRLNPQSTVLLLNQVL